MREEPLRVLFIHGLESRPDGSKARALRASGFEVCAPDLEMGLAKLGRRQSVARQALRMGEVRCVAAGLAAGWAVSAATRSWVGGAGVALAGGVWWATRRKALFAEALARSFASSVEVAGRALAQNPVDVVVGSSWGGAVAAKLVVEGAWRGPTILLAPAIQRVLTWTRDLAPDAYLSRLRAVSADVPMVIFHDPSDDVVPYADSVALAQGRPIDLRTVSAGGHRLMGILNDSTLADAVRACASPPPSPARSADALS
jgi:hypothetical protein